LPRPRPLQGCGFVSGLHPPTTAVRTERQENIHQPCPSFTLTLFITRGADYVVFTFALSMTVDMSGRSLLRYMNTNDEVSPFALAQ
jgi:hypothetical protein